ncbi:MAG TPA: Uma2 family endonuclease [Ktedonobacteraceae bacterium]|nr:Uma2 family endonuclease [Ktedonobacteraceae bacterium]
MVANRADHDREYMTVEEYLELDSNTEGVRYEYIDGYAYMMSGGTNNHARICANLVRQLGNALEGGPCEVFTSDARVQIAEYRRILHPDVTVSCQEEEITTMIRHPRVVVEVLSSSTKLFDLSKKLLMYQSCPSIEAIMFVDPDMFSINLFLKEEMLWINVFYQAGELVEIECLGVSLPIESIYRGVRF